MGQTGTVKGPAGYKVSRSNELSPAEQLHLCCRRVAVPGLVSGDLGVNPDMDQSLVLVILAVTLTD